MNIDKLTGLLAEAVYIPSPNCDNRPQNTAVSLLVIHNISLPPGEFGGPHINQLFCNELDANEHPFFEEIADLKVSSHLLIRRDGQIIQYVSFNKRAWHAGVSEFSGRTRCNDFSIGIELEGTDEKIYETIQYKTLTAITNELLNVYPGINNQRIQGHCHIASGRKTDPGKAFDWDAYLNTLNFKHQT